MKYTVIIFGFLLLLAQGGTASSPLPASAASPAVASATGASVEQAAAPLDRPLLLAESWFGKFYRGLVSSLGSRKAMFQFAMVGMLVALMIIWWRK